MQRESFRQREMQVSRFIFGFLQFSFKELLNFLARQRNQIAIAINSSLRSSEIQFDQPRSNQFNMIDFCESTASRKTAKIIEIYISRSTVICIKFCNYNQIFDTAWTDAKNESLQLNYETLWSAISALERILLDLSKAKRESPNRQKFTRSC